MGRERDRLDRIKAVEKQWMGSTERGWVTLGVPSRIAWIQEVGTWKTERTAKRNTSNQTSFFVGFLTRFFFFIWLVMRPFQRPSFWAGYVSGRRGCFSVLR